MTVILLKKVLRTSRAAIFRRSLRRESVLFVFVQTALTFRPENAQSFRVFINLWRHKQPLGKEASMLPDSAPSYLHGADLSRLIWDFTYD